MTSHPPHAAQPAVVNGRYRLVVKIAEGGTGEVFRAFDSVSREWRAVKMLLPDLAKRTALRARFEREGHTMARLVHHNIAKVYEAGTDAEAETAFLVMEYAEAGSVTDWLERNRMPMPPRMAVQLILEVCEGIQYAHEEGVIHRDIKPQNLLLDRYGTCKVSDFGIAMVAAAHRMTLTGTVMGTLGYVAPEQYESAKHTDVRADVYSIAATLYTLVHGEAANHLFMADESDYAGIPKELANVIRKGAQYQRDSRHQTVAEFAAELQAILPLLPEDPLDTPPLVPEDLISLDEAPAVPSAPSVPARQAQLPAPAGQRQAQVPARKRQGSTPPIPSRKTDPGRGSSVPAPVQLDNRTPSSIIPRASLTGDTAVDKLRRPRIRTREELERQAMISRAVKFGLITMLGMGFIVFAVAVLGQITLEGAQRSENVTDQAFVEKIHIERVQWEELSLSPHLSRGKEIRAQLEQLEKERIPARREALVDNLSTLFKLELRELEEIGSAEALVKTIEETDRRLATARRDYSVAAEHRQKTEASMQGTLARYLLFFMQD